MDIKNGYKNRATATTKTGVKGVEERGENKNGIRKRGYRCYDNLPSTKKKEEKKRKIRRSCFWFRT